MTLVPEKWANNRAPWAGDRTRTGSWATAKVTTAFFDPERGAAPQAHGVLARKDRQHRPGGADNSK